jgi:hypothetical protein
MLLPPVRFAFQPVLQVIKALADLSRRRLLTESSCELSARHLRQPGLSVTIIISSTGRKFLSGRNAGGCSRCSC